MHISRQPGTRNLSSRSHCCQPRATSPLSTPILKGLPAASVWHRGSVLPVPGARAHQSRFFPVFPQPLGGATGMFRGTPCFLASSCTRQMAFLGPCQGIQNAEVPHLSCPGKLLWLVCVFRCQTITHCFPPRTIPLLAPTTVQPGEGGFTCVFANMHICCNSRESHNQTG